MRATVMGYFALMPGDAYIILDSNKKEIGKLDVLDGKAVVVREGMDDVELEEKDIGKWFENNKYMLTKTSPRWVEFNPNPGKNTKASDCTIRAYCAAEKLSWDEAFEIASQVAKDNAWMPNDKAMVEKIITDKFGYEMCKLEKDEKKMTVSEFAIKYNVGTYLVEIARHLVAVVDGQYYDTWDCGDKKVSKYFAKG